MPKDRVLSFDADSRFFHKRAVRSIDKQDYLTGLKHLRKAIELDPDNVDIALDIADTYARMGLYEQSNMELGLLLHKEDCPEEAMFAIGCNYMAMGDYAQAYFVFEAYLESYEGGEYSFLARDGMDQIEESEIEDGIDRDLEALAEQGKYALDSGDPSRAAEIFKEVLEKDPTLNYVRNNLALAYVCLEDVAGAWKQLSIILRDDSFNVHACCNAALLLKGEGDQEKAERFLLRLNPEAMEEIDELYKYCLTAAELNISDRLMQGLRKILLLCPYEVTMLYLMGVCLYNEGKAAEAVRYFEKILAIEPSHMLARAGVLYCQRHGQGTAPKKMRLSFEYGEEHVKQIDERLFELLSLYPDQESLREKLRDDDIFLTMQAALQGEDETVAKAIVVLAAAGGPRAENQLRRILLSVIHSDTLKQMAMDALTRIGAKEPYFVSADGRMVRMYNGEIKLNAAPPKAYALAMTSSAQKMGEIYGTAEAVEYAVLLWSAYLNSMEGKFPPLRDQDAWFAAIKGRYESDVLKKDVDVDELAREADATPRTVMMRMRRLWTALLAARSQDGEE